MLVMAFFGAPVPLVLMGWYIAAAPGFAAMFADFAATLPSATMLVLQPWWGAAMIATYLLALPLAFVFRDNMARDFALVAIVVGGTLAVMASAACLYLPIVELSQSVR